jgi:hypothetical protein
LATQVEDAEEEIKYEHNRRERKKERVAAKLSSEVEHLGLQKYAGRDNTPTAAPTTIAPTAAPTSFDPCSTQRGKYGHDDCKRQWKGVYKISGHLSVMAAKQAVAREQAKVREWALSV